MKNNTLPILSVIIPTYNKINRLKATLYCLEKQSLSSEFFEVCVINDGSTDGTEQFLYNLHTNYHLAVINQHNQGQAIARNKGLSCARGSIIVFIDDDLLCTPLFLQKHIEAHQNIQNSTQVVLGRIYRIDPINFNSVIHQVYKNYQTTIINLQHYVEKDIYLDMVERVFTNSFFEIAWICFTGGNSSVGKEFLKKVNNFDPNFFRWGPEDIELGYRLFCNHATFSYSPDIVNFHLDVKKNRHQLLKETAFNLKYLQAKYSESHPIKNYINFTSGGMSLEEFFCKSKGIHFDQHSFASLFRFSPFDYINLKSQV